MNRTVRLLIPIFAVLAALWLFFGVPQQGPTARAKGGMITSTALRLSAAEQSLLAQLTANSDYAAITAGNDVSYLYAVPLGSADNARLPDCAGLDCQHITFYDFANGGTIEVVYSQSADSVIDTRIDLDARPMIGPSLINRVIDIAQADSRVTAILGDLSTADVAMIPMSAWLTDNGCNDDWCVDMTYHDPTGSGRIIHVMVNLTNDTVSRIFYSRGREARAYTPPDDLDDDAPFYTDGCANRHGWDVCWEMTPHDGVNFYDATFEEKLVFSSAKITQVEAFYPSWPGGYRDEIGYLASVPPKFDTRITDFGNGFEVRQLFTEPFDWPNCICCYRYEQIIDFYDDGTFEARFISQGPGCDELSVYRPFWRIDVDLNTVADDDEVWFWDTTSWVPARDEIGLDLFGDLSIEGQKLATFDGDTHYRWQPQPTDPLGLDGGRVYVLRYADDEDGPILTGPANTYEPPSAWANEESVTDENIVIWYVPDLKTKKGEPWWCAPDPEPDFSPCEAILRVSPDTEIRQPTAEELAAREPTPTPEPESAIAVVQIPRAITGVAAEEIILNSGCGACHLIGEQGEAGKVGPNLSNIGNLAHARVPGQSAEEYLRNSILYPNLVLVENCPNGTCLANVMPGDYYARLTDAQVDTMVAYMLELQDESAVTGPVGGPADAVVGDDAVDSDSAESVSNSPDGNNNTVVIVGIIGAIALVAALFWLIMRRLGSSESQ